MDAQACAAKRALKNRGVKGHCAVHAAPAAERPGYPPGPCTLARTRAPFPAVAGVLGTECGGISQSGY